MAARISSCKSLKVQAVGLNRLPKVSRVHHVSRSGFRRGVSPQQLHSAQSDSVSAAEQALGGVSFTSRSAWTHIRKVLKDSNVKFLSPQEVNFARERGAVLLDVRTVAEYNEGHLPGAVNAQFYQPISGWTAFKVARRLAFAFFGVFNGTEFNTDFVSEVKDIVPDPETELIVYCGYGGNIEGTDNSQHGNQTRATIAVYFLLQDGHYTNVAVLKGGFSEWSGSGREVEAVA